MDRDILFYLLITALFFAVMLLYFRIAKRYNIIDKPNERSSHAAITIRGGGIVFLIAALAVLFRDYTQFLLPVLGLLCIGIISFLDDIYTLRGGLRILVHFAAVTLLFFYFHIFSLYPFYVVLLLYILVIGIINAWNFMDGINGIMGIYSLVILASFQYINIKQLAFIPTDFIRVPLLACLVFLFFNFRRKAVCFAGDVGSVTIAFWILVILFSLVIKTGNGSYCLFLSVYGVDSVLTIIHRLLRKENIFDAHRLHFYQLLANEQKLPHTTVAAAYGLLQLLINIWVIKSGWSFAANFLVTGVPLAIVYILVKPKIMAPKSAPDLS